MVNRDMSFFMADKIEKVTEEEVYVSKRTKDNNNKVIPFIMKAIPTEQIEELEKDCMEPVFEKGKKVGEKFNRPKWLARIGIESTVYPGFRDKDLLKSYNVVSSLEAVKKVLSVGGEYAEWIGVTQRINGFEEDFEDLVKEAKNSSGAETETPSTLTS